VAKKNKSCKIVPAPPATTDRTIDERGTQRYHAIKLDNYEKRTTVVQSQQIYQEAAIVGIKNEKPKTAAVTAVMSFYNKRLVIKARLLDDPTPIIDTAESVPPNVRSASHFLPQREYIGRAEDRPKINQVVLVRVPPNGSYEVPGTIVEITDEITGPPIRVPKKKKDKSKGAKAAAKGQPAGGIPESPIPGDSTGKKVNPQNQIPKVPEKPAHLIGTPFSTDQEALDFVLAEAAAEAEALESVSFLSDYAAKEAEGRAGLQEQRDGALQDFAEEKAKLEEERAKQEREEATRKAKEDAKKAEDIAKGKEQAPVEEVKEIETEGDPPPAPPVTLTQEERARVKEINIPPYYDEERERWVAFAKAKGPALKGINLANAGDAIFEAIEEAQDRASFALREFIYEETGARVHPGSKFGIDEIFYIPARGSPGWSEENVKVVIVKVESNFALINRAHAEGAATDI